MSVHRRHLLVGALLLSFAPQSLRAQEGVWRAAPLAASPERLAAAAGLEARVERWRLLYDVSLRIHPTSGGAGASARRLLAVRSELQAPPAPSIAVPVPLGGELWRSSVLDRAVPDQELTRAILLERRASLAYRALSQLEPGTLAFFAAHPRLLEWIVKRRAEVFTLVAGSLEIRGGRVIVPGQAEGAALFEDLVGESPSEPEAFLRRLFERKEGRLALMLRTIETLDPPQQRFALGLALDPQQRRARFRALAQAFGRVAPWWLSRGDDAARPLFDPGAVLSRLAVAEDGRLQPPGQQSFWEAVFGAPGASAFGGHAQQPDAAWLAAEVGLAPTPLARVRLAQLRFAQRVFAEAPAGSLPEAASVLRGLADRPALVLVLERLGLREPSQMAELLRAAGRLEELRGSERARALARFQGALVVLDRARMNGAIAPGAAAALALSLARLAPAGRAAGGAFAGWLDERLLPELSRAVDRGRRSAEDTWRRALAGARGGDVGPAAVFDWEGLPSRADPAAGEGFRLEKVRRRQHGNRLDDALEFARLARAIAEGRAQAEVEAQLRATPIRLAVYPPEETRSLAPLLDEAASGHTAPLVRLSDGLLAEALVSLSYAPHLGAPEDPVLAGGNVALRHDFGVHPFALPQLVSGFAPWHVEGSLLALEVALAPLALRRVTPGMPEQPACFEQPLRVNAALAAVLRSPFAMDEVEARDVVEAIARGRARVAGLVADPGSLDRVAEQAGLASREAQGLRWLLANEPAALGAFFSLDELRRLGGTRDVSETAFGLPQLALGGGLLLERPSPRLLEQSRGHDANQVLPAALLDPLLRVVSELESRRLPAVLAPATLALLTRVLDDEGPASLHDDPRALGRFVAALPAERFDDLIAALVGTGPLVPADSELENR